MSSAVGSPETTPRAFPISARKPKREPESSRNGDGGLGAVHLLGKAARNVGDQPDQHAGEPANHAA